MSLNIDWKKKGREQYIAEVGDFELVVVGCLWNVKYGFIVVLGGIESCVYQAKEACVEGLIQYSQNHGIQLLNREGDEIKMGWIPLVCPVMTE